MTKLDVTTEQPSRRPAPAGLSRTNERSNGHVGPPVHRPESAGRGALAPSTCILVVARDEALRAAMCADLDAAGFVSLAFEHTDAVPNGPADRIQCAVLGLNARDGADGTEAIRVLLRNGPRLPVVVVGNGDSAIAVVAAMRAGARDYLRPPIRPGELADAVRAQLERTARDRAPQSMPPGFGLLTRYECEVLDAVIRGCSTKQIAAELGRVEKTIEYHRARIMEKLGVQTSLQAVRLATLHGWSWDGAASSGSASRGPG